MAIINAVGVGKAYGSMGNITYRLVKGRTIGSQKRGRIDPSTRAEGETLVQFIFGLIARYASLHSADIKVSFDATMFGSARNAFIKLNFSAFTAALQGMFQTGLKSSDISDSQLADAIEDYATENQQAILRVKKGALVVYLKGAWSSSDNPVTDSEGEETPDTGGGGNTGGNNGGGTGNNPL